MSATPETIARYLRAADEHDYDALADCFAEDGVAVDEGQTHVGRQAIRRWRETAAAKYTWTTVVTGTRDLGAGRFNVSVHLTGDFPGGEADLTQAFTLRDGEITHLAIA